jgi:RNA 2',3'-cyclic 3'-phosphodiesterase
MSAEVESAIAELVDPLRKPRSGARWLDTGNLHLTLRFLGDKADRNLVVALDRMLSDVAAQTRPFLVEARGTGAFPNLERPRVIWIGLVSEELIRLAQKVEKAATEVGFEPEGRPYSPHLTIARVRDLNGWQRIRRVLHQSSIRGFGSTLISEMILYRSILGGQASRYQPISRYAFSAMA